MIIHPQKAFESDDAVDLLGFALEVSRTLPCALATLVGIDGGAARSLGSHVVVAADGRYAGYVSGGCVEAAIATEALLAIHDGADKLVSFGKDSPFKDIVLPCGGDITIAIHVLKEVADLRLAVMRLSERHAAALAYDPAKQILTLSDATHGTGWKDGLFINVYHPSTRTMVSGGTFEVARLAALMKAAEMEVVTIPPRFQSAEFRETIDAYTAVVLMHHDLDKEIALLDLALESNAFYIGALGSRRTHEKRVARLRERGHKQSAIDRIKAPIGAFGPARTASALGISIVADVTVARTNRFGS